MMIMVDAAFNVERERGPQMRFDSSGGLGGREKKNVKGKRLNKWAKGWEWGRGRTVFYIVSHREVSMVL